jgi:23S rRNA (cytidine2498-2'-O)-methyltransferase
VPVDIEATTGSAYVCATTADADAWHRALRARPPWFARSIFVGDGPLDLADAGRDRVTPIVQAIATRFAPPWRSVWVEFPDTNEGKALSTLARALSPRLEGALREGIDAGAAKRLHVFLTDGRTAFMGESEVSATRWPMGIARLRMPPSAPSRSTLKLAEAIEVFLGEREPTMLRAGMRAVDLGAAPGGWTWQFVQRGVAVVAVDNGPLKGAVRDDPLVAHVREDAFRYRPRRPVDWLVCDVVEQPVRVAELVARWIAQGLARRAIFNLKLPMKKRYDEVRRCEERIAALLRGTRHTLVLRQLYHDREEVTGFVDA